MYVEHHLNIRPSYFDYSIFFSFLFTKHLDRHFFKKKQNLAYFTQSLGFQIWHLILSPGLKPDILPKAQVLTLTLSLKAQALNLAPLLKAQALNLALYLKAQALNLALFLKAQALNLALFLKAQALNLALLSKAQTLNLALTSFTYPIFKHKLSKIPKYQTD